MIMGCSYEPKSQEAQKTGLSVGDTKHPGHSMRDSQGGGLLKSPGQYLYLGHLPDYITGHTQALHEGACCHKSTRGPQAQLSRGIPERMQRLGLLAQAVQVVVRQQLGVQLLEEALQQPCPELGQRLLEVQVGPTVVEAQLSIQVPEGPSVLRIQVSKGPRENLLQCALRVIQQALEVVCAQRRGNDPLRGGPAPLPIHSWTEYPPASQNLLMQSMKAGHHIAEAFLGS